MNQFKDAWNFYLNHWQYFALLAAPILAIEVVTAQLITPLGSDAILKILKILLNLLPLMEYIWLILGLIGDYC